MPNIFPLRPQYPIMWEPVTPIFWQVDEKRKLFHDMIASTVQSSSYQEQVNYNKLHDRLVGMVSMKHDWDSYGAEAPSNNTIGQAKKVLVSLYSKAILPSTIAPSAEGGVTLFFRMGDKCAYIEYGNDGEHILAKYSSHSDPEVTELTDISDPTQAIETIKTYLSV